MTQDPEVVIPEITEVPNLLGLFDEYQASQRRFFTALIDTAETDTTEVSVRDALRSIIG